MKVWAALFAYLAGAAVLDLRFRIQMIKLKVNADDHLHLACTSAQLWLVNQSDILCHDCRAALVNPSLPALFSDLRPGATPSTDPDPLGSPHHYLGSSEFVIAYPSCAKSAKRPPCKSFVCRSYALAVV